MKIWLNSFVVISVTAISACSSAPLATVGAATGIGGVYLVTADGETVSTSGAASTLINNTQSWNPPDVRAYVYDGTDIIAAAIVDKTDGNKTYAGLTGIPAVGVPVLASATYTGGYALIRVTEAHGGIPWGFLGNQTSIVNFDTGKIVGAGGADGFSYSATISGDTISGTASFSTDGAVTVPLTGGFYGASTLAGAFVGDTITGYVFGTNP